MTETPSTSQRKRTTTLNYADGTVTIDGVIYSAAGVPADGMKHFAMLGFSMFLLREADPATALEDVRSGKRSLIRATAAAKVDLLREAAATERALALTGSAKAEGYFAAYAAALVMTASWTRADRIRARGIPKIAVRLAKLTGAKDGLSDLFKAPAPSFAETPAPQPLISE